MIQLWHGACQNLDGKRRAIELTIARGAQGGLGGTPPPSPSPPPDGCLCGLPCPLASSAWGSAMAVPAPQRRAAHRVSDVGSGLRRQRG